MTPHQHLARAAITAVLAAMADQTRRALGSSEATVRCAAEDAVAERILDLLQECVPDECGPSAFQ